MKITKKLRQNIIRVFIQAREFEWASKYLGDAYQSELSKNVKHPTMFPIAVNSAFALELYLKCLLYFQEGSYPKYTHKIMQELFKKLNSKTKTKIRRLYEEAWSENWRKYPDHPNNPPRFRKAMNQSDNAFVIWRYYFQYPKSARTYFGALIIPHVKSVIAEMIPEVTTLL